MTPGASSRPQPSAPPTARHNARIGQPDPPPSTPTRSAAGSTYGPGRRRPSNFGRRRLRNRLLRGALLLVLMAGVGGLTAVFLQGRQERLAAAPAAAPRTEPGEAVAGPPAADTTRLRAEQFESTLEREGAEVFHIRGARTSSDDQGNVLLNQVEVDYPRGDDRYALSADGASYNEETRATHLHGSVSLQGTNGLVVDTDWMDLAGGGMVLTAADDSRFDLPGVSARGNGLRMDFRQEIARMAGGVHLVGTESRVGTEGRKGAAPDAPAQAFSLTAGALEYHWSAGILRALEGTEMQVGNITLAARALTLNRDHTDRLASLEARGRIEIRAPLDNGEAGAGNRRAPAEGSVLVLRGEALEIQFDDAELPGRMVLSGPNWGGRAVLRLDGGDGSRRRIRAKLLDLAFVEGMLAEFTARGRVELQEHAPDQAQPVRAASSVRALGRFDADGDLVELKLEENVVLTDRTDATSVSGADEATIDTLARRADFRGQPARLVYRQGEIEGSRVLYDQANGCVGASEEVRATLGGKGGADRGILPFGERGAQAGSSSITADEALLCEAGESRFRGGVEVRQGPDLLAAAQLRLMEEGRQMVASGGVRATWHPQPIAGSMAATEAAAGEQSVLERWSVSSARLNYDEADGELRFSGRAAAMLGDRRLECDELTVEAVRGRQTADPGVLQAQNLFCLGNARLDDGGDGRSVTAVRAIHSLAERRIRFLGDVVLREGPAELQGPSLTWWIDRNRYEMGPSGSAAGGGNEP